MSSRVATLLATALLGVLLLGGAGCGGRPRTTNELVAQLRSPDPGTRRGAADRLRGDRGVDPQAVEPLLEAARTEQNLPALGAMLITLGRSGAPEALPLIQKHRKTNHPDMRRWTERALRFWTEATAGTPAAAAGWQAVAASDPAGAGPHASSPGGAGAATTEEVEQLDQIRQATDPETTLSLAEAGHLRFGGGPLWAEREVLAIAALARLGRGDEARDRARRFLEKEPESPYAEHVRRFAEAE